MELLQQVSFLLTFSFLLSHPPPPSVSSYLCRSNITQLRRIIILIFSMKSLMLLKSNTPSSKSYEQLKIGNRSPSRNFFHTMTSAPSNLNSNSMKISPQPMSSSCVLTAALLQCSSKGPHPQQNLTHKVSQLQQERQPLSNVSTAPIKFTSEIILGEYSAINYLKSLRGLLLFPSHPLPS
jgi:hypothetical protein